uniref:SNORC protein n=1 Tax=Macrostomum lignano TaxID=282301 RepID=A0A1I8FM61_9PLAT
RPSTPGHPLRTASLTRLATSGAPNSAAELQESDRPEPAGSRASDRQYLTDTDYVVPMRSRMMNQQELSGSEISVYVAIGVLTLIAVTLIIVGLRVLLQVS